jgi:hypothetical protein
MHILFIVAAAFITFILALLIAGLFIKKDYLIQRYIVIDKPAATIFDYVKLVKNQQHFNKWWMIDPAAVKTYRGIDGTEGFVAGWDSQHKQAGKGEQELIKLTENERLDYEIRFERPFSGVAYSYIILNAETPDTTTVTWCFKGVNKFPLNVMSAILKLNEVLGKDLQLSLQNLKNILDK